MAEKDLDNSSAQSSEEEENMSNDGSDQEGSEDESDDEMKQLKQELSEIPFSELQALKEKVGTKKYNEAVHGMFSDQCEKTKTETETETSFKRDNKNRPRELSSKKKVPYLRQVVDMKKKVRRDPRFDDMSGEFNEEMFSKSYSFIDNIKDKEKQILEKEVKKTKNAEKKEKLQTLIKNLESAKAMKNAAQTKKKAKQQRKKAELELVKKGKQPFYLKKSEEKKVELAEKYKDLKASGKLETFLGKRRKKNASKERRHLPERKVTET